MDLNTYLILHLIGLGALAMGLGGMFAGENNRKMFSILQGVALLIILISGFGLLGKLQLGFPHFAMVKVALWVILGVLPVMLRRLKVPIIGGITISLVLIGILAWLGVVKPALW